MTQRPKQEQPANHGFKGNCRDKGKGHRQHAQDQHYHADVAQPFAPLFQKAAHFRRSVINDQGHGKVLLTAVDRGNINLKLLQIIAHLTPVE